MRKLFTKNHRLRKKSQFQALFKENKRLVGDFLLIHYRNNPRNLIPKLGLSVSCRFGKAHDRNYFKRMMREYFRLHQHEIPSSLEINIAPRKEAKNASYALLATDMTKLLLSPRR